VLQPVSALNKRQDKNICRFGIHPGKSRHRIKPSILGNWCSRTAPKCYLIWATITE